MADKNFLYISWTYLINLSASQLLRFASGTTLDHKGIVPGYNWKKLYEGVPDITRYRASYTDISWTLQHFIGVSDCPVMIALDQRYAAEYLIGHTSPADSIYIAYLSDLWNENNFVDSLSTYDKLRLEHCTWLSHESFLDLDYKPSWLETANDRYGMNRPSRWDAIYIDRSDAVCPPHIDAEFIRFCHRVMYANTHMVTVEEGVLDYRY